MKKEIRVFTLPGEERELNNIMNNDLIDIVDKVISPCPKEGVILYLIEMEKH